MIYIVIPVFNRLHFTKACIQSLLGQSYKSYKIIVVDDGSTDGTAEYLNTHYPQIIVVPGNGNLWWTGATNAGVEKALQLSTSENDFILTLNNDLVVKENYLQALLDVHSNYPKALIGSVSVNIEDPETIHFAGTKWNSKTAKYKPALTNKLNYTQLKIVTDEIETDLLPGRGILIPIKLFKEIGLYDAKSFPHYMADEDFSLRAKAAGYTLLLATKAAVCNHVAATGLAQRKKNFKYYIDVFTSIKSPMNSKYRWNWAKRHATVFPPIYFTIDLARIVKSLIIKL
jgi:GT2 family glycosyltransferase